MLYHSGHIFLVAKRAYERAQFDHSEAMPAIILSTVAFECFVNEAVHRLSTEAAQEPTGIFKPAVDWLELVESKRPSTLERVDALHLALTTSRIDRGTQPYQDLSLLYQLRNELVHRKPERALNWDPNDCELEYEPHKYVKALASKGVIEMPSSKAPPVWGQFVLNERTAKWAFNTAVSAVQFLTGLIPESVFAKTTEFMVGDLKKVE